MHRVAVRLLFLAAALTLPASAAPRFAIVRITEIYKNLSSTANLQKDLQHDREEIVKDERAVQLRKIIGELEALQKQFQGLKKKDGSMDESAPKVAREFEMKRQEAQTLQQEFEAFNGEKTKEINRKMVLAMRASLDRIAESARKVGKAQGFDGVFDSSGSSNTGVPVVLYSKDSKDITDDVIAVLKDAGDPTVSGGGSPAAPPAATTTPAPAPAQQ